MIDEMEFNRYSVFHLSVLLLVLLVSILVSVLLFTSSDEASTGSVDDLLQGIEIQPSLAEHSKEFDSPEIVKVTDGVYVAVGYALANSILLEGPGAEAVVVDVTESVSAAQTILTQFKKHSSKRITDIVFTHNHGDHVFGAEGFIDEDQHSPPNIWAFHTFADLIKETHVVGPKLYRGFIHQMGTHLGEHLVTMGLGPKLKINGSHAIVSFTPNKLIYEREEAKNLAGLNITFIHVPGETDDQLAVWLPSKKVLLPADNIYKAFPNLYAIRGTAPRDTMTWHDSLRRMRNLKAEHLVPSHTRPVSGSRTIYDIMTGYMAGIQYVHDQTVRRLNEGLHPDEISSIVSHLPGSLASHPYLQQFYGSTVWSSKGVYENYIGWFSGDPVDLLPLSPMERSRRLVQMVGAQKVLIGAETAAGVGDLQWALELVSHVFRIDPKNESAKKLRRNVLRRLAGQQSNPISRNYYMTTILNDHGVIDWTVDQTQLVEKLPIKELLQLMRYRLKSEAVDGTQLTIAIHFNDTDETFRLQILHSILEVLPVTPSHESGVDELESDDVLVDVTIVTTTTTWKKILLKRLAPAHAISSGDMSLDPATTGLRALGVFFSYFKS